MDDAGHHLRGPDPGAQPLMWLYMVAGWLALVALGTAWNRGCHRKATPKVDE